MKRKHQKEFRT